MAKETMKEEKLSFKDWIQTVISGLIIAIIIMFLILSFFNYEESRDCRKLCKGFFYGESAHFERENILANGKCYCERDGEVFTFEL